MEILGDIKKSLSDKKFFWLNLSILLYTALLPFNAFGLHLSKRGNIIKFTEITLLLIAIFLTRAHLNDQVKIKKAPWLYALLFLQFSIQFVSIVNSPIPDAGFDVAIAVASYSILIIVLFNAIRSERLLRAIMTVMGIAVSIIVIHSFIIYLMQGGVLYTRKNPTLLGNDMGGYLAYALLLFGPGLLYVFFQTKNKKIRYALWLLVVLWMWVVIINPTKRYQIAAFILLLLLMATLIGQRKKVFALILIFIALLFFQLNIIPIRNQYRLAYNKISGGALELKESEKQEKRLAVLLAEKRLPPPPPGPEPSPPPPPPPPGPEPSPPPPFKEKPTFLLNEYSQENLVKLRWAALVGRGSSIDVRARGIVGGWMMGWSNPWTGIGAGQTPRVMEDYSEKVRIKLQDKDYLAWAPFRELILTDATFSRGTVSIYNTYMSVWAETGVFGLLALLGVLGIVIIKGVYVLYTSPDPNKIQPLSFLLPLLVTIAGVVYMTDISWVQPWPWTIIVLTYAASTVYESK